MGAKARIELTYIVVSGLISTIELPSNMVGWVGLEPTMSETPNLQSGAVPIVPPPQILEFLIRTL